MTRARRRVERVDVARAQFFRKMKNFSVGNTSDNDFSANKASFGTTPPFKKIGKPKILTLPQKMA